jgi:hypothetical protein
VEPVTFDDAIMERFETHLHESGSDDCGAYLMSSQWVELFAGMSAVQANRVAMDWAKACDSSGSSNAALAGFVDGMCTLCRAAQQRGVSVVYTWTL